MSFDENDKKIDQETTTNETEDLDENENLNSVEDAELKRVNNERIIPAAESMGEDSTSYESSYESPEQNRLVTLKKRLDEGNHQPNRRNRRRRDPKTGLDESEEYDTLEEQDEASPLEDNKIDTPENEEHPEYNQSNEHEPETSTNEVADKPGDILEQNEEKNKPNRRHRRRRDPKTGLDVSEEYDTLEEQDEESLLEDNKIDTPENEEHPEYNQSNEHETEEPSNEVVDKPSEINEQNEGMNQPSFKNRGQRRPKKPKNVLDVPEDYETDKQNNESPAKDNENVTPSETREYIEDEQSSEIPKHEENPEYNESYEHEPETPTNEVANKPSDILEQDKGNNKPNRRHRRRRDPKTGLEVSEEYDTLEEQDEESPLEDNKIDTPENEEHPEYNQSNEHEPETSTNEVADKPSDILEQNEEKNKPNRRHRRRRDPKTGLDVSEEYDTLEEQDEESPLEDNKIDTPENEEHPEYNQSNEHEPETSTNEVADKPSDILEQDKGNNKPNRRHRRRRDPKTGLDVSEEYDTLEEQDEESPLKDNKIDTPENEEHPEYNQSNEHEPETSTNEVADKPSDILEQNEEKNKPNRRHRRRRDPKTGLDVSEEYDTLEEQDEESPLEDNKIDTPENEEHPEYNQSNEHEPETSTNEVADKPSDILEQNEEKNKPNRRHRRRRVPKTGLDVSEEYDTLEEQDEESPLEDNKIDTPENEEHPEYNQSNEHEPETSTNEVADKPSDILEQDKGNNKPNRRHRRRRDPKTGLDVSEEYDTLEEQDEESPLKDNKIDTPENEEHPEYNQSNEHEPETSTNEVADKPSDILEQNEEKNKPNRRHRRRRDPKTGLDVSEEYDTLEEQDEESPLEDNKIDTPENEEHPEYNQSNEHEPETSTNEVADKPSDILEQDKGNNKPNRRHRRRRDPKTGLDVSEEYDTLEEQDEESPLGDNKIDTPENEEHPEYNQSNEHEPETSTNEVADKPSDILEQDKGNNKPNRRHRRRRDPKTGLDVSEEYDTLEEQDEESPLKDNKIDTPENEEHPEYNQSNEHEPETSTNEVADKPSDILEQNEEKNKPNRRHRRRRDPKTGLDVSEEYDTLEEQDEESPLEDNKIDTQENEEHPEYNQSNEHEPETSTNDVADKPSDILEQDKGNNKPNRRHRRRRDPKTGLDESEEYDTLEEQDEASLLEDNKIDTPENEEHPEYNQSNEHETEEPSNEIEDKPSEINEQNEGMNQPSFKNRGQRRPKKPKNVLDVPEDYETDKQNNESPAKDNENVTPSETREYIEDEQSSEIPKHEENPEYNESYEYEPETPTNEVANKPSDILEQDKGNNKPNRRHRRRRDPKTGLDVSEEYDTLEEQDEVSPLRDNKIDKPEYDESPEYKSYEHEPETPTNEVLDKPSDIREQDEGNNKPTRRHRRRRDPKTGLESSEEYDTLEEQDEESPLRDNKIDEPEYDENPDYKSYEHEPETPTSEVLDKPSDIREPDEGNNKPTRRHRRRRDPKTGLEVSDEYDTLEEQDEESPLEDNKIDTPEYDENPEYNQSNDVVENNNDQPESSEYPENADLSSKDSSAPIDSNENGNIKKPHARKLRWRRKPKQPQSAYGNDKTPIEVNDDFINNNPVEDKNVNSMSIPNNNNDVLEEDPHNVYEETNDNESDKNQPELSDILENSDLSSQDSATPIDTNDNENVNSRPRKIRRRRKPKQPQSAYGNDKTPIVVNDENINNYPVEDQDVNSMSIPNNNNDVLEEDPYNVYGETNDNESDYKQPESSVYPENTDLSTKDSSTPIDTNDNENLVNSRPRKIRRRRKPKQPQSAYGNDKTPIVVNDENINNYPVEDQDVNSMSIPNNNNDVLEEDPYNVYGETNDNESDYKQPESSVYPENADLSTKDSSTPIDTNDNENLVNSRPRKIRRRRKPKQPQSAYGNDKTPIVVNDENINNYPVEDQDVNSMSIPNNNNDVLEEDPYNVYGETNDNESDYKQPESSVYPENADLSTKDSSTPIDTNDNENLVNSRPRKIRRRRKPKQPQSAYGNDKTPIVVNDENINNYPVEDQDVNSMSIPNNNNDVLEEDPYNVYGETNDNESDYKQPESSVYPENTDLSTKDSSTPIDTNDNENLVNSRPRKIRRRRKPKQPQSAYGNDKTPIVVNDENINNYPVEDQDVNSMSIPNNNNDVLEEDPYNVYGETNDNESDYKQPESSVYPENADLSTKDSSTPIDTNDNENLVNSRPRKIRRRRKPKQPQSAYGNDKTPIVVNDENINNYPVEDQDVNSMSIPNNNNDVLEEDPHNVYGETNDKNQPELSDSHENSDLSSQDSATPIDTNDNENVVKPRPRKIRRRRKSKQPQSVNGNDKTPIETNDVSTKIIPTNVVRKNSRNPNEEKSTEIPEIDQKNIQKNPKKKRHIRRIRTYAVNNATNERIPINDQTYSTTDGLPDDINNKLDSLETDDSKVDDPDSNTDNDDYSSFLFKEYNSDQCKRDAYDRFKKVTSQDAKQIAYRSVLDTSEMRSNMLATLKNAIDNVKASRTFNDVDQSLRTVSYSLKVGLKQTVSDLVIKVIPLAKDFLKTAENLKELYQRGPQSTHKMLTNILENESTVPESAKDILRLISPQFDVDELINNIFEKPCTAKSLKEKKVKAQRKLIDLSKHMDTAISNIDCFVLSAMSTVGIGADTLKLLKSGKVIMSDKHPRAKTLRDAVGIIKAGKKIRNNDNSFTPTLTSDGTTESDEDDDDEDPDQVAQKNEEFLKTVPDLDDDIPMPKKVKNKRQSLGVIVVHTDKQIEYKEITDTSQLKKFIGDQTKKYKLQSKNKHPKFLKLNSKQLIDDMVADVKKKAERNGMTKKEMVDEIIKNLNSS